MAKKWEEVKDENGEKERFVNPYNFVPFAPADRSYTYLSKDEAELKTGYIECSLTVLTPLFIPNTSSRYAFHNKEDKKISEKACSYDFFSYENLDHKRSLKPRAPVIPGSEIRGAVRSVYEAAFDSCVSTVDLERVLKRRSPEAKKAGILKKIKESWSITPCERLMLNTTRLCEKFGIYVNQKQYEEWCEGEQLYIKRREERYKPEIDLHVITEVEKEVSNVSEWEIGYLHKGECFGKRKHHESVFVPLKKEGSEEASVAITEELRESLQKAMQGDKKTYVKSNLKNSDNEKVEDVIVSEEAVKGLRTVLEEYNDAAKNKNLSLQEAPHRWYPEYEIDEDQTLVYYQTNEAGEACYLSPACIGKEIFQQDIKNLLKNSRVEPCTDKKKLCAACTLFGMVSKEAKNDGIYDAVGSRVRFGDAVLKKVGNDKEIADCYIAPILLPEMGEPKPGTAEFYMLPPQNETQRDKQENSLKNSTSYWTYDYEVKGGKNSRRRHFFSKDQVFLRGRKFYWHNDVWGDYGKKADKEVNPTAMRQLIRPLKTTEENKAIQFGFRVYFECVTLREIQQLCWALDLGRENCAHKLGRGKPLGFGSVQIAIEGVVVRKIDSKKGLWENHYLLEKEWRGDISFISKKNALKEILQWKTPFCAKVCYPMGEGADKSAENALASHQWFRGNRSIANGATGTRPLFAKVLPKIEEETAQSNEQKWLYKLEEKEESSKCSRGKK